MVSRGLGGERQLLRTGLRQGAASRSQKRLVPVRLARERQLLHPLRGNIDHDYAGRGLARLYETARRKLADRKTSATISQFPNGERLAKCVA